MKKHGLFFAAMVVLAIVFGCATMQTPVLPLPNDLKLIPTDSAIKNAPKYIDIWSGFWPPEADSPSKVDTIVVVERIEKNNRVSAIYSWGAPKENYVRVTGKITADNIILEWFVNNGKKRTMILTLREDDKLSVELQKEGRIYKTILQRSTGTFPPKK